MLPSRPEHVANRNGSSAGESVLSRRISTINMRETTDMAEILVAGIAMQSVAEDRIRSAFWMAARGST